MDFQALVDGLNQRAKAERSKTQMTLGGLIERLEAMEPSAVVSGLVNPHSYRGYYCDLAFEPSDDKTTAAVLLETARNCMGETFTGYKGGDFDMGRNTPVWIAPYGCCGEKILDIDDDGMFATCRDD